MYVTGVAAWGWPPGHNKEAQDTAGSLFYEVEYHRLSDDTDSVLMTVIFPSAMPCSFGWMQGMECCCRQDQISYSGCCIPCAAKNTWALRRGMWIRVKAEAHAL